MRLMPVKDFGYGIRNYFRSIENLRPMKQLENLFKLHHKGINDEFSDIK